MTAKHALPPLEAAARAESRSTVSGPHALVKNRGRHVHRRVRPGLVRDVLGIVGLVVVAGLAFGATLLLAVAGNWLAITATAWGIAVPTGAAIVLLMRVLARPVPDSERS